MIRLSASKIKSFIRCSKMFQLQYDFPEEAVDPQDAAVGTIVHNLIEYFPDGKGYEEHAEELIKERAIDLDGQLKIYRSMKSYSNNFADLLAKMNPENDIKEFYFQEKLLPDVILSGRIDYIIKEDDIVLDWKTGTTKRDISNDPQFIIYYTMYQKIFGRYPTVYQVSLAKGELNTFYPRKIYIDTLYNSIIPKIIRAMETKDYHKEGYFNGSCYRCSFIGLCSKEP